MKLGFVGRPHSKLLSRLQRSCGHWEINNCTYGCRRCERSQPSGSKLLLLSSREGIIGCKTFHPHNSLSTHSVAPQGETSCHKGLTAGSGYCTKIICNTTQRAYYRAPLQSQIKTSHSSS